MGWVTDLFHKRSSQEGKGINQNPGAAPQSVAQGKWNELLRGIEQDAAEFGRFHKTPDLKQLSDFQYRVSNSELGVALLLTADIPASAIHYEYQAEEKNVAVPEGGFFALRPAPGDVELYSADQHLTTEQARRLILEPLFFPPSVPLQKTGT